MEFQTKGNGERGYLEGLASRYADLLCTHYVDVLRHLEELRIREWEDLSPRIRVLGGGLGDTGTTPGVVGEDVASPASPPSPATTPTAIGAPEGGSGVATVDGGEGTADMSLGGLTTSLSQPIYVPGKYSPSSCLSDREEDEIYGFGGGGAAVAAGVVGGAIPTIVDGGYGVFGQRMMQRHRLHRRILFSPPPAASVAQPTTTPTVHFTPGPPHASVQLPFQR
ncbi:hypothetical protein J437_LFUL004461 [Ladona fulva]|uniref:Uncharacterized protein n=1 Tax=Ladona fulva TaxID=123851 RepID=A0A8K0JZB6_LADFU|nr:hypothetical protein J437_LFUL004461 [Ladona fulva]